jgi:hypothetical protein
MPLQIFDIQRLEELESRLPFRVSKGIRSGGVIVVGAGFQGVSALLEEGVLREHPAPAYSDDDRAAFVKDYTGLIAALNERYQGNLLWWATDLSSKNRYVSGVPDHVFDLWACAQILEQSSGKDILIVVHSPAVEVSLRRLLSRQRCSVVWCVPLRGLWLWRLAGITSKGASLFYNAAKFYARALYARIMLQGIVGLCLTKGRQYHVIKTFSYSSSWDDKGVYVDPFFGRLAGYLRREGRDVVTLTYHWQGFRRFIERVRHDRAKDGVLPIELFISLGDVLGAVVRILLFRIKLPSEIVFRGVDVTAVIADDLFSRLNGVQIFQLLHYAAIRRLSGTVDVAAFVFTFENNPWERVCILAFRRHSPSTVLLGYQHSVVPPAALNMFVASVESRIVPLPDKLLTTGEIPAAFLRRQGDYSAVEVIPACALRYEYLESIPVLPRNVSRRILVVLDGVWETCALIEYVLRQAKLMPEYTFVLRPHPALPWTLLASKFKCALDNYPFVQLSEGDLYHEISLAGVVLYWQSAVALEALCMGRPVISFMPPGILGFDPAFDCPGLKCSVEPLEELKGSIEKLLDIDDDDFLLQSLAVRDYVRAYFHKVTPDRLDKFLGVEYKTVYDESRSNFS